MSKQMIINSLISVLVAVYCGLVIFLYLAFFNEDISFVQFLMILLIPVAVAVTVICWKPQKRKDNKKNDRK